MSILNILAYVGIGLGSAIAMLFLNCALGRTKVHYIVGDNVYDGSRGSFIGTFMYCLIEVTILIAAILSIVFNQSILKSAGLSVVILPVVYLVTNIISFILYKSFRTQKTNNDTENISGIAAVITCLINGALLAVILAHLGIF